ncbi:MAG: tetratricopeptide repeat protein [Candidatus Omnitrophota bacterium]
MNKSIKIFLLLAVVTGCLLWASAINIGGISHKSYAQESSKEEEALFVAKKAFEDGFYEVSLGLLERFLNNYPGSSKAVEANLLIGRCYFQQNKFLDALAKFEGLLGQPQALNVRDAVLYWIAEAHFKGNGFNAAATYYQRIINEFPRSSYIPAAYYSLGWCLFQEQKFQQALEYFKVVEEKYPREPQARDVPFKIAECLYNLKDYSGLKSRLKDYIKIYSQDPTRLSYLYFYMAEAEYYLNNFSVAADWYHKAFNSSRDDKIQALSKLGQAWAYLKLKQYKDSEAALREVKADKLEKKNVDVLLLGKAILMTETNRVNEAEGIYQELLNTTLDPLVLIQAYLGKGDALYNLADYQEAVNVYKEAIVKAGAGTVSGEMVDKLHYNLAWAFLKQGEFKEAIKEFQKIIKTSDDNIVKASALCQIGDAYQDSGDYNKAQETYDTILKDYPDNFYGDYVQYQLGLTLLKNSNYDGAVLSFLTLKNNFPKSKLLDDASYALGLAYFQKQDYNSSKDVFAKFQEEFKDSSLRPQAMYLLGTSLYNLGDFPGAIEVFKNIARGYGQDTELTQKAEYEIADCFYQMGEEKEAMARFKALRSKYPDSKLTPEIMWWLGEYYYRHNELELARRYFTSLIRDFPKSNLIADAYYALGSSFTEESRYEEAIENFKKIEEPGRSDLSGQAAVAIADIYVKQDKADSALNTYQEVIKEYPGLTNLVYPKMAGLFYKMNKLAQALDFYRQSLDLVPAKEMAGIQFKIAEVLEAQEKIQEAIEEYLKVTYLYAEDNNLAVKALLRVAEIYEGKGDLKEAVSIYKRIISLNTEEAKYAQERIDWIKTNNNRR